jgi:tRNA nucleotidyltransferase (CCA-adding enzyme)
MIFYSKLEIVVKVIINQMSEIKLYLVGGAVRDQVLGIKSKDLDYVVTGLSSFEELKDFVTNTLKCEIKVETQKYGVVRCVHPTKGGLDFALPRVDFNQDGRQSDVKFVETIQEDLSRRDFTINAMACEVDNNLVIIAGSLIDPFEGYKDIKNKLVRFVGNPNLRIDEDNLRVLRALRFSLTKGFDLDQETANTISNVVINDKVSGERIMDELNKMFAVSNTGTFEILSKYNQIYLLNKVKIKATT